MQQEAIQTPNMKSMSIGVASMAGCDGYLTKPINEAELARMLSTHIKRSLTVGAPGLSTAPGARPPFQSMS